MHRDHGLRDIGHAFQQHADQGREFLGDGVAHGVRDVDGAGAGVDRRLDTAAQEIVLGAGGVLGRPFHVAGKGPGQGHAFGHLRQHGVGAHLELVLHVQRAGGDERMDTRALGRFHGLGGAFDVDPGGPGEAADGRLLDHLGDLVDGLEIAVRRDREAGLDDVDAHAFENLGDAKFLVQVHGRAGRLFTITKRGVEDGNAVFIRASAHGINPSFNSGVTKCDCRSHPLNAGNAGIGAIKAFKGT